MTEQYNAKRHINGIAAESKYPRGYKLVGIFDIDTNAKTLAERNQAEQQKGQAPEAEEYSGPGNYFGLEEPLGADKGEIERSSKVRARRITSLTG